MTQASFALLSLGFIAATFEHLPDGWESPCSVWIQAYQENFQEDSVSEMLVSARQSYVLLDAFQDEEAREAIPKLKQNGNLVSVYMSIGTGEKWRADFLQLKPFLVSKQWSDWEDEFFVDRISDSLIDVMKKRIDRVAEWGADMIEFDNMDWAFDDACRREYQFQVTNQEAIDYYQLLCEYAIEQGLQCMAKNTTTDADRFAGVTFESSHDEMDWWEAEQLRNFLTKDKLGIVVHYNEPDPSKAFQFYQDRYGKKVLFIAESRITKRYVHFNLSSDLAR